MEVAPIPSPKRILYVITKSNWGGAQRYVFDMAYAAKERGYEVLVAAGGEGELKERLAEAHIPFHSISGMSRDVNIFGEIAALGDLVGLMRSWKPDVVHLNSSKAGVAALAARLVFIKKIIFTVHGWAWNENRPGYQKVLIAVIYWFTLLFVHTAIAVSNAALEQGRRLPFVWRKIRVVHNGVHQIPFVTREEARARLVPGSDKTFWIGTIAELHRIKGLDVLVEAFEHFTPDIPDSELVIIGEGDAREELEHQIRVEGVGKGTRLVGHVPDASRFLSAFDMFVLPSRSEGLAYVLLEAGQAKLPVVATNVGGIPEVIENGVTGTLVPVEDREALTQAMLDTANNKTHSAELAAALHTKVCADFSLEKMLDATFALY